MFRSSLFFLREAITSSSATVSAPSDQVDVPKGSTEIFFHKVKFWKADGEEEAPRVFGYTLTSEIDGTIQMKSYLTGNPEIRLAFNEDVSIGRGGRSIYDYSSSAGSGVVILEDCNFHESVHLEKYIPPDGEFPVMNYRMTQEFKPPFCINALIEAAGPLRAEFIIKVHTEFPSNITVNTIVVQMPLPTFTTSEFEPGTVGQTADFKEANKRLEWSIKKIVGGAEHTLCAKVTFSQELHQTKQHQIKAFVSLGNFTKEAGPINMMFTIPMYNASRLQVKY